MKSRFSVRVGGGSRTGTTAAGLPKAIERIATESAATKGRILFREGQNVTGVYLVRRGAVRLSLNCPSGTKKVTYRTVGPGYILGLPASVRRGPYSLTAEAITRCELAFATVEDVTCLLRKRRDLCLEVIELLSSEVAKLRRMQSRLGTTESGHRMRS